MSRYSMDIGPVEPVRQPDPYQADADRARREREAREALDRRLAERQAMRGYIPQRGPVLDEYGMPAENALPPDPVVAPRPPGAPVATLPAFDAPTADAPNVGLGQAVMTSPPPTAPAAPMGQPNPTPNAPSTSPTPGQLAPTTPPNPAPVADTSTDPNAPTVTAGAQAAQLAQGQPQPIGGAMGAAQLAAPPMRAPGADSGPRFAMGATGLGAPDQPVADRAAGLPSAYEQRLATAQAEDDRRDRIRRLLQGLAVLMGAATAKGGGGGAIPLGIAAGMVRPSNQADRVRATDEREQALGAERARQQAVLDQLAQRREAQAATERNQQQQLALRLAELQGTQQDRAMRTGIALRENEREEDLLDPASAVSARERQALRTVLQTQPREVQAAYTDLSGYSATELRSLRDDLERGGRARTIAGQGRSAGGSVTLPGGAPAPIATTAPRSYVLTIVNRLGNGTEDAGTYSEPSDLAVQLANAEWARLSDEERRAHIDGNRDAVGQEQAGRQVPGFVSAENVAESDAAKAREVHAAARRLTSALATMIEISDDASLLDRVRAGGNYGAEAARYRAARQAVITAIRVVRGLGTPQGAELEQLEAEITGMASLDQLLNGADSLRAARQQFAGDALMTMESYGYRPTRQGSNPLLAGPVRRSDAGEEGGAPAAPQQRPEERRRDTVTLVVVVPGQGPRRVSVPAGEVERRASAWRERGWEVRRP